MARAAPFAPAAARGLLSRSIRSAVAELGGWLKDAAWLARRRQLACRDAQSRTDTRLAIGYVAPRWDEGVVMAKAQLGSDGH